MDWEKVNDLANRGFNLGMLNYKLAVDRFPGPPHAELMAAMLGFCGVDVTGEEIWFEMSGMGEESPADLLVASKAIMQAVFPEHAPREKESAKKKK